MRKRRSSRAARSEYINSLKPEQRDAVNNGIRLGNFSTAIDIATGIASIAALTILGPLAAGIILAGGGAAHWKTKTVQGIWEKQARDKGVTYPL